jgi:hypothetical protein
MDNERNKLVRINISDIEYSKSKLKENDFQLYEKLKLSIQSQGQLKSITVCELENGKYECIEGSKILKCMIELNCNEVIAINIGKVTQTEKDIIRLQLFKDFFMVDYSAVGVMLKEILNDVQIINLCNTIPFDKRQVENLINLTKFDWDAFNLNKQNEGQMSLFGNVENSSELIEEEDESQLNLFDIVEKPIEEVEQTQIIVNEIQIQQPIELHIEQPIKTIIEKPIEPFVEKSMSSLFETVKETPQTINHQQTIEKEEIKTNIEVSHEYAHIVYEQDGEYKMMPERQYFDIGKKYEQLHRNTYSNCRLFIHNLNQKSNLS